MNRNRIRNRATLAALLLAAAASALAQVKVEQPWARPTVEGQMAGGAFLKIQNVGGADRLLSASSSAAGMVQLHSMAMEGDVMKMREVEAIDLPAGKTVELKPGGLHLMLMGLKSPLKEGSKVPLTLKFEKAGEVKVEVPVAAKGP